MPILHMIRETARLLASQGLKRPGILATDGTIQSGLYQKEFEAVGIQATVPTPPAQKLVMSLIYDDVKSGRDRDPQKFAAIHRDLEEQGCDCGVLACTELSVFADMAPPASLLHRRHGRPGRAVGPGLPQAPAAHLHQIA